MPKVSIVIPIYNCEKHLEKAINSALRQTLNDLEIILVDDGSTDNSGKICDEYELIDKRVRVIHKKNSGPGTARNVGIDNCNGKYIGFLDSDDEIEENMYEILYKEIEDSNSDVVICGIREIDKNGAELGRTYFEKRDKITLEKDYIEKRCRLDFLDNKSELYDFYNKLYRREWLINTGVKIDNNLRIGEDWLFNFEILALANRITIVPRYLYKYFRVSDTSLMFSYRKNEYKTFCSNRIKIMELLKGYDIDKYKANMGKTFFNNTLNIIYKTYMNIQDKNIRKEEIFKILDSDMFVNATKDGYKKLDIKKKIIAFPIKNRMKIIAYLMLNLYFKFK